MCRAEHFARRFVGAAYGRDHQVGLFAFEDVAADGLAQPLIAVAVQQVVLQLECQSQFDGEAAQLAAYFSQGRESANVPVDYTPVKFVKKPAGGRPGMVIYTTYQTLYVTPDEQLVQRLASK